MTNPTPQHIQITQDDVTELKCENCGGKLFGQAFVLSKLSPLHPAYAAVKMQNGGNDILPFPITFMCLACGTPFNPNEQENNKSELN